MRPLSRQHKRELEEMRRLGRCRTAVVHTCVCVFYIVCSFVGQCDCTTSQHQLWLQTKWCDANGVKSTRAVHELRWLGAAVCQQAYTPGSLLANSIGDGGGSTRSIYAVAEGLKVDSTLRESVAAATNFVERIPGFAPSREIRVHTHTITFDFDVHSHPGRINGGFIQEPCKKNFNG